MKRIFTFFCLSLLVHSTAVSQNIFSGERVQVVGAFNGYVTTPYGTDYRTTTYRRLSVATGTPTDGRGQWSTTINVQSSGGDVTPINMPGGSSNGFLFISGPAANRFQNKWVFSGIGQGTTNGISTISAFNSGNDMGLNMSAAGYYTFVFNDAGYTATNARYYVGVTDNTPVTVTRSNQTVNLDRSATIDITTSATPSTQENIYARYVLGSGSTFSGTPATSIVQATGAGTAYTATIPIQPLGTVITYYVFTSTRTLAQLTANTEPERSIATLNYDDAAGVNYTYNTNIVLPLQLVNFSVSKTNNGNAIQWQSVSETNNLGYTVQSSTDGSNFQSLQFVPVATTPTGNYYNYNYVDGNSYTSKVYYRLQLKELNGMYSYSKILSTDKEVKNKLQLLSSAVSKQFTIKTAVQNNTILQIINTNGELLQSIRINKGNSIHNIDLSKQASGSVFLILNELGVQKQTLQLLVN
jgi:hypothetical protein